MISRFESGFANRLRGMPNQVAKRAAKALELFEGDERHPGLHFKRIKGGKDTWSIRVTKDYRLVGYRLGGNRDLVPDRNPRWLRQTVETAWTMTQSAS